MVVFYFYLKCIENNNDVVVSKYKVNDLSYFYWLFARRTSYVRSYARISH